MKSPRMRSPGWNPTCFFQVVDLSTSRCFSPFKTLSVYSASSVRTREHKLKDILHLVLVSSSRTVSSQGVLYLHHRGMEGRKLLLLRRGRQNSVTRSPQSLIHVLYPVWTSVLWVGEHEYKISHPIHVGLTSSWSDLVASCTCIRPHTSSQLQGSVDIIMTS